MTVPTIHVPNPTQIDTFYNAIVDVLRQHIEFAGGPDRVFVAVGREASIERWSFGYFISVWDGGNTENPAELPLETQLAHALDAYFKEWL